MNKKIINNIIPLFIYLIYSILIYNFITSDYFKSTTEFNILLLTALMLCIAFLLFILIIIIDEKKYTKDIEDFFK